MKEFATAFRIVWYIISLSLLLLVAAPFLVPKETLLSSAPACRWKVLYNRECALCGMSTAFVLIAEGRIREAGDRNAASVPLYVLMLVNCAVFIGSCVRRLRSFKRTRKIHPLHPHIGVSPCKSSVSFGESLRSSE